MKPIYTLYFPVHFTIIFPSISSVFQVMFLPSDFLRKDFMLLSYFSNFLFKTPILFYNLIFHIYYYTSTLTYNNFANINYCKNIF